MQYDRNLACIRLLGCSTRRLGPDILVPEITCDHRSVQSASHAQVVLAVPRAICNKLFYLNALCTRTLRFHQLTCSRVM